MKILVENTIGRTKYTFEVEERDEDLALLKASFFGYPATICGKCGGANIFLEGRKASSDKGDFTYISVKCKDCGAFRPTGKYKGGGFFWKRWEDMYVPPRSSQKTG